MTRKCRTVGLFAAATVALTFAVNGFKTSVCVEARGRTRETKRRRSTVGASTASNIVSIARASGRNRAFRVGTPSIGNTAKKRERLGIDGGERRGGRGANRASRQYY